MVLGLAAYGRTYLLAAAAANNINAPTTGNGFSGSFTKINGLLSYYEVNKFYFLDLNYQNFIFKLRNF
jgi:hypothetical protein